MKLFHRLALALAFLSLTFAPLAARAQVSPMVGASVTYGINVATATTTEIVPLTANKVIYVSFVHVESAGTGNVTFVYGSGTNCGSGTTSIGGAISLTAQTGFVGSGGLGPVIAVPVGKALCLTTSAAVQISGWLTAAPF